jgi:peptidyl-tRNA hydrolase, PTH1 family
MYLIVGLGNPGDQYRNTRHNVGFDIIDLMSDKYNISLNRIKFKGIYGEGNIKGNKVILLKPQTYMNLSGESVREASSFFKTPSENIIVLYDDISLEAGRLRIRPKGSAGGHNGIKSIIAHLNSEVFPRIKVGVGQPKSDLVGHVLGKFEKSDREKVEKTFDAAIKAVEVMIEFNTEEAMNKFNGFIAE